MLVRVKVGSKAGQIEDVEPVCARLMLEDGRATDPRDEVEEIQDVEAKQEKPRSAKRQK